MTNIKHNFVLWIFITFSCPCFAMEGIALKAAGGAALTAGKILVEKTFGGKSKADKPEKESSSPSNAEPITALTDVQAKAIAKLDIFCTEEDILKLGTSDQEKKFLQGKINERRTLSKLLHETINHGSLENVQQSLADGADINARFNKKTPLIAALEKGRDSVTEHLLERNCDVNLTESDNGNTPLHVAAEKDNKAMFLALLFKGADASIVNKKNLNVFATARSCQRKDIMMFLINADKLNTQDKEAHKKEIEKLETEKNKTIAAALNLAWDAGKYVVNILRRQ